MFYKNCFRTLEQRERAYAEARRRILGEDAEEMAPRGTNVHDKGRDQPGLMRPPRRENDYQNDRPPRRGKFRGNGRGANRGSNRNSEPESRRGENEDSERQFQPKGPPDTNSTGFTRGNKTRSNGKISFSQKNGHVENFYSF